MLDYQAEKPRYQPTRKDSVWRLYRLAYYELHLLVFLVVGFKVGPNLFLFHRPFSPGLAGYVRYTDTYVPIIAAIKAYNRDCGNLPLSSFELPPAYRPRNFQGDDGYINDTTSITFFVGDHGVLEYEFFPGKEGWYIHAPRYDGSLPAPIVAAAPKPTTPAVTQPAAPPSSSLPTSTPHGQ